MYVDKTETLCGDATLDAVIGVVGVVNQIPGVSLEYRAARIRWALPLLSTDDLISRARFGMGCQQAYIQSDERPKDWRERVTDVEFIGETGLPGQLFKYMCIEDEPPVNDLGLTMLNPILFGLDVKRELGIETFRLQVPVQQIVYADRLPML